MNLGGGHSEMNDIIQPSKAPITTAVIYSNECMWMGVSHRFFRTGTNPVPPKQLKTIPSLPMHIPYCGRNFTAKIKYSSSTTRKYVCADVCPCGSHKSLKQCC